MIEELRIRGLGVIDDAVLELGPGLTVVTGETGAGKTMVVTGLGLLLGGRADAGAVRPGADRILVEGRVALADDAPALARVAEAGGELDEGSLLLARAVSAEGRSRAWVGGRAVPVSVLGELAADLVAVHGQSDQQRLLQPSRQRDALDAYAGDPLLGPLAAYRGAYADLQAVEVELAEVTTNARSRAQEADLLRFGLREVEAVDPQDGEDVSLAAEAERLSYAEALRGAADVAHATLLGDPEQVEVTDVLTAVVGARRAVDAVRAHDARLAELGDRLAEVAVLVGDVGADLAGYADAIDADPTRLAAVNDRRAALGALTRKYGASVAEVLEWAARAAERLVDLDDDGGRVAALRARRSALLTTLAAEATRVHDLRAEAARTLSEAVTDELGQLAMPHASVQVVVSVVEVSDPPDPPDPADPAGAAGGLAVDHRRLAFGPHGVDTVEILLAAHPGAPSRPLARGASGGELSRVMLAVEVVLAGADAVPTYVFDEVDAGVGGRAAVEVGRRLARLARSAQVLVVTHLPQVAAFADRHLLVEKASDGVVTRSGVATLDDSGRVAELTRMLAGLEGSESGRAHAEELLATAAQARAGTG